MSIRDRIADALPTRLRDSILQWRKRALRLVRDRGLPCIVRHNGIRLVVDELIPPVVRQAIFEGWYEGAELKTLRRFMHEDDVVMEMGTGIGFTALWCSRRLGCKRVYTFEANPMLEPLIRRNCEANDLRPELNFAILGPSAGECEFYLEPDFWASSTSPRSQSSKKIFVKQRALNEEIRRIGPSLLVMDIEGGEAAILEVIDFQSIRRVSIELHPDIMGEAATTRVRDRFAVAGFKTTWASDAGVYLFLER